MAITGSAALPIMVVKPPINPNKGLYHQWLEREFSLPFQSDQNMTSSTTKRQHKEKITLREIADYVKLNSSALCRYFRQRTDKSIFQCLAEIRVEHACILLSYSNLSVSQIAYESGYGNVPYFIKQFESITRQTPKEYRISLLQGSENRIKSSTFDAR